MQAVRDSYFTIEFVPIAYWQKNFSVFSISDSSFMNMLEDPDTIGPDDEQQKTNTLESAFEQAKWQLVLRTCADLLVSAGELKKMSELLLGTGEVSFKKGVRELGARALQPYLRVNDQVISLKFEEGDLGDAGLRILVDGCANNETLTSLTLTLT